MRRVIPFIMFLLMEITLISLGVWQLQRKEWKEAILASREKNANLPAFFLSHSNQVTPDMEYRRVNTLCFYRPTDTYSMEGFDEKSAIATRWFVKCSGPSQVVIDLGWGSKTSPLYGGAAIAPVSGRIRHWPLQSAAQAMGGIKPISPKNFVAPVAAFYVQSGDTLPPPPANNHFAYAMQWFIFAGVLLVIFTIWARRQRLAPLGSGA
jgi:surfeit locus 1 family protein